MTWQKIPYLDTSCPTWIQVEIVIRSGQAGIVVRSGQDDLA